MSKPLEDRYIVKRRDLGDLLCKKHEHCRYLVIDLTHDPKAAQVLELMELTQ